MFRMNPTFAFSVLYCLFSNHVVVVQCQNARCSANRCIRPGSSTDKYTTCGVACTTITCVDLDQCFAANNAECAQDACVSEAYLRARAEREKYPYCDPCCSNYQSCMQQYETGNGFTVCFSAFASTDVLSKGKTLIKDLQVGDKVLTASGGYKRVYTIDHKHPDKATEFLQIYTSATSPLELTENHFVFLHNKKDPVPAGQLKVGDALQVTSEQPAVVTKISSVTRNGLWNPLTEDGTIVVDGIVTSTYTALELMSNDGKHSMYLEVGGYKVMSKHDFVHLLATPYRAFCVYTSSSLCEDVEGEEYSSYSQFALQLLKVSKQLPPMIQNALAIGAILLFSFLYVMVMNPLAAATLSVLVIYYYHATPYTRKIN